MQARASLSPNRTRSGSESSSSSRVPAGNDEEITRRKEVARQVILAILSQHPKIVPGEQIHQLEERLANLVLIEEQPAPDAAWILVDTTTHVVMPNTRLVELEHQVQNLQGQLDFEVSKNEGTFEEIRALRPLEQQLYEFSGIQSSKWIKASTLALLPKHLRPKIEETFTEEERSELIVVVRSVPAFLDKLVENPDSLAYRISAGKLVENAYRICNKQQEYMAVFNNFRWYTPIKGCRLCHRGFHCEEGCIQFPTVECREELYDANQICYRCSRSYIECFLMGCNDDPCSVCKAQDHCSIFCRDPKLKTIMDQFLLLVQAIIKYLVPKDWNTQVIKISDEKWSSNPKNMEFFQLARKDLNQVQQNVLARKERRHFLLLRQQPVPQHATSMVIPSFPKQEAQPAAPEEEQQQ